MKVTVKTVSDRITILENQKTRSLNEDFQLAVYRWALELKRGAEAAEANANQLRAVGVESFAHQQRVIADSLSGDMQRSHRITACRAESFAAQLRAGEES